MDDCHLSLGDGLEDKVLQEAAEQCPGSQKLPGGIRQDLLGPVLLYHLKHFIDHFEEEENLKKMPTGNLLSSTTTLASSS